MTAMFFTAKRVHSRRMDAEAVALQSLRQLDAVQGNLLERARKFVADNTTRVTSWDEFRQVMAGRRGFIIAGWCGDAECEARIKQETKATVRVIPFEGEARAGSCVRCGRPSEREVYFAQAY